MKVTLINMTQNAKELLLFTKNTRLDMSVSMEDIKKMSDSEKEEQLFYMLNTIKSSWEYVDFTFSIEDVSRAFTHQFVRTRTNSYAQQTMRMLDKKNFTYHTGPSLLEDSAAKAIYDYCMSEIQFCYDKLIAMGIKVEDARGILPTDIHTNITVKINLRTLSDMMQSRASSRTQSEYRDVIEAIYQAVIAEAVWVSPFLRNSKTEACNQLEAIIIKVFEGTDQLTDNIKLVDQLRNSK